MVGAVWLIKGHGGQGIKAAERREFPIEAIGGRTQSGSAHAAGHCFKKALKPAQKRDLLSWLKTCYKVSVRRACRLVRFRRATFLYNSKRPEQAYLRMRIKEIASEKPRYGYRRITILIRRESLALNPKRVYRIYKEEGLQMRKKVPKRRVSPQLRQVRVPAARQNQCWSMDFVSDNLYNGQKLRCLTIVDNHTRISPAIGVGFRYTACQDVETLNQAVEGYGQPECIRVDNGPEFISRELDLWAYARGVQLDFSRPGKLTDNAFNVQSLRDTDVLQGKSFNSRFRQECLNQHWFLSLEDAQAKITARWTDYNEVRPHSALGEQSPHSFAAANAWPPSYLTPEFLI